jgi:hypothetical protein
MGQAPPIVIEIRRGFRMHLSGGAPSVCLAASSRRNELDRGLCLFPFFVTAFCVFALAPALANYVRQRHSSGAAVRSGDIERALLPEFLGAPGFNVLVFNSTIRMAENKIGSPQTRNELPGPCRAAMRTWS